MVVHVISGTWKFDFDHDSWPDAAWWTSLARHSWPGIFQAHHDSSSVSERPRTTVPDGLLHPGLQCWHSAASVFSQPSTCSTSFPAQRFRLSGLPVAGPMVWNSLPDFIRDPAISTDCSRCVLKKCICSLDSRASSALAVLDNNVLYKSTYLRTFNHCHCPCNACVTVSL